MLTYLLMCPVKRVWETCRKGIGFLSAQMVQPGAHCTTSARQWQKWSLLPSKMWIRNNVNRDINIWKCAMWKVLGCFGDKLQNTWSVRGKKYRSLFCKYIREFLLKVTQAPGTASWELSFAAPPCHPSLWNSFVFHVHHLQIHFLKLLLICFFVCSKGPLRVTWQEGRFNQTPKG